MIDELTIEELFDKIYKIESENDLFLKLENKKGHGHCAELWINDFECHISTEFHEFRLEALEDLIFRFEENNEV